MPGKTTPTYEAVALGALHAEFSISSKEQTEATIRKRVKRMKLGAYDQARVDLLRRFKDEVQKEIGLQPDAAPPRHEESPYFVVRRHGTYGDYTDFDIPRWTSDMVARYPDIPKGVVAWFVHFAVGTYYLL
jgi:hypothetical protein